MEEMEYLLRKNSTSFPSEKLAVLMAEEAEKRGDLFLLVYQNEEASIAFAKKMVMKWSCGK